MTATKKQKQNALDNSIVCGIVLAVLTIVAYAGGLHGKFVFDDQQIVMQNPQLMSVRSLADVIVVGAGANGSRSLTKPAP